MIGNIANAGGSLPIKITNINSISNTEHQIYFQLLEKSDNKNFSNPLSNCDTVTLNVELNEWEFKHKIRLFFDKLLNPIFKPERLENTIHRLKEKTHEPMLITDIENLPYINNNQCNLLSKQIQLSYGKLNMIMPIRHYSNIANKKSD